MKRTRTLALLTALVCLCALLPAAFAASLAAGAAFVFLPGRG